MSYNTCQLIDDLKSFNLEGFENLLSKLSLPSSSSSLNVISILGPQSSGKSTLLNSLFSSQFQVMDQSNRRQTTKGIWLTIIPSPPLQIPTIILDVEGTDGRERGDDQDFERKSALFSLAVSDILLINIWENSVGLYHGANMSLLRTVMDVHLKLNSKSLTRKTIFFIIRDYIGNTPKENITSVLSKDIENIWISLSPPNSLHESFDLQFAFLPHYHLQREQFLTAIEELKPILLDFNPLNDDEDNDILPRTQSKDWGIFSNQLWTTIQVQKDLDLPSEREMLSQIRCEQISQDIYWSVLEKLPNKEVIFESILRFQRESHSYSPSISKEKESDLSNRLWNHANHLLKDSTQQEQNRLLSIPFKISTSLDVPSFLLEVEKYQNNLESEFLLHLQSSLKEFLSPNNDVLEDSKTTFSHALEEKIEIFKYENCVINFSLLKGEINSQLFKGRKSSFSIGNINDFWLSFDSLIDGSRKLLITFLDEIKLSPSNEERFTNDCNSFLESQIEKQLISSLLDSKLFLERLQKKFDSTFLKDENGHLRIWSADDVKKIEDQYRLSLENGIEFANILCEIPYDTKIISIKDREGELESLREWADKSLISVKRDCISKAKTEFPLWIFAVMIILGWNHIVYILKRPLLLILVIFLILIAIIFRKLQLQTFIMMYLRSLNIDNLRKNNSNSNSNSKNKSD